MAVGDEVYVLDPGTYFVQVVRDDNGCSSLDSLSLLDDPQFPEIKVSYNALDCARDSTVLNLGNSFELLSANWDGPDAFHSESFSPTIHTPGQYLLTVTGVNGCVSDTVLIIQRDTLAPEVYIEYNDLLVCAKTTTVLDGSGSSSGIGYKYQWYSQDGRILQGAQTLNPIVEGPGTYILEIINTANHCFATDSIVVAQAPNPMDSVSLDISPPACFGYTDGMIRVADVYSGNEPIKYSLDGSFFSPSALFSGLSAGEYLLRVRDASGCALDTLVRIEEGSKIELFLDGDPTVINLGESALLTAQLIADQPLAYLKWAPPELIVYQDSLRNQVFPQETTWFTLEAEDINGCRSEDQQLIVVIEKAEIYIPNTFSPNGDGLNDTFFVKGQSGVAAILQLDIFDRWGNKVFTGDNLVPGDEQNGWTGYFNGKRLLPGVYVYHFTLLSSNGKTIHLTGDVTLLW